MAGAAGKRKVVMPLRWKMFIGMSGRLLLVLALLLRGAAPACAQSPENGESTHWSIAMTGADTACARGYRGQNVRIGVIDSGINPHPDLAGNLTDGHNYITDAADPNDTSDAYGHGTRVAGLLATVAPEATIVPLKITNSGSVNVTQLCRAIYGAVDNYGCDVLNLSLGVPYERESLREAIAYAAEKGVTVVAATGNDGTSERYYPAAYDSVIGVCAVDSAGAVSVHSNHNESVMIAAPGVQVRTTGHRGGYVTESGCSFAVPYVSAAVAILKSADGSLPNKEIMRILSETATDRGITGRDEYYGFGIVNIAACLEAILPSDPVPTPAPPPLPEPTYAGCPRDAACVMAAYSDLDRSAWYHDGVHYALETGMMNGVGADRFAPDAPASRAMVVTVLWRLAGEPAAGFAMTFADVPAGTWYAEAVRWAASAHIVEGYSSERFGPDDAVSREQLATILYRYVKCSGADPAAEHGDILNSYTDAAEISSWALSAVRWTVDAGVIRGTSDSALSPGSPASRAQTAAILMRCMRLFE